jgi:hypothetical protein
VARGWGGVLFAPDRLATMSHAAVALILAALGVLA